MSDAGKPSPRRSSGKARVFLVDDHAVVREGLAVLLDQTHDLQVCGQAATPQQALKGIAGADPDIVVLHLSLGKHSGLGLLADLRAQHPQLPVLVLSMHDEAVMAERALRTGARGYVMKQEATQQLLDAVRRVLAGGPAVSEAVKEQMVRAVSGTRDRGTCSPIQSLSNRELEVFELLGGGLRPAQIAQRLSLSVKTVETHFAHIRAKLGLGTQRDLAVRAVQWMQSRHL